MQNALKCKPFEIEVGMNIVGHPLGNYARGWGGGSLGKITKIGRKYFYVRFGNSADEHKVSLETFDSYNTDHNNGYQIFRNMEDYKKALKMKGRRKELHDLFGEYRRLDEIPDEVIESVYLFLSVEGVI